MLMADKILPITKLINDKSGINQEEKNVQHILFLFLVSLVKIKL
jgi:hypothetical protein